MTECGHDVAEFAVVLTRDELVCKVRDQGMQRAGLSTCMTCLSTAQRWPTFVQDPVRAMGRVTYMGRRGDDRVRRELLAVAELVERHRAEYLALVESIGATTDIGVARAKRRAGGRD